MKVFRTFRILIFLLFLATMMLAPLRTLQAQDQVTGAIEGYIFDATTRDPIPGVLVQLINTDNGQVLSTRTDEKGYYRKGLLPPGDYRIRASIAGYAAMPDQELTNLATKTNERRPPIFLSKEVAAVVTPTPEPAPGQPTTPTTPSTTMPQTTVARELEQGPNIASEMNVTDARRSDAYTDKEVSTLSLGGTTLTRTFDELGLLAPGVALPPQTESEIAGPGVGPSIGSAGQFAVNGMRSRANNFTVDGSDNNDEDIGVRRQGFFSLVPQPIESVKEFQIITALAPAQFGRNFGAQVNALSKSGGDQLHGTVFGFLNTSQLNARNFFDTANGNAITNVRSNGGQAVLNCTGLSNAACIAANRPITTTNQSGGEDSFTLAQGGAVLGGPIKKGKAFFFVSYEREVLNASQEHSFAVPTVDQRGIFNSGATGFYIDCLDHASPAFNLAQCNFANRAQYFADRGFPTEIHGDAVLSFFPFPNNPTGVYGANTFTENLPASARGNIASGKYDQNFSMWGQPQTFTVRYNFTQDWRDIPVTGGALFSALRPRVRTQNFSSFLTSTLSDRMDNVLRLSYGRTRLIFDELRDPFLIPSEVSANQPFLLNARRVENDTLPVSNGVPNTGPVLYRIVGTTECGTAVAANCISGTPNSGIGRVGQINVAGFSSVGVNVDFFPQRRVNNTYQVADTLGYHVANHSFSFGEDIRRVELNSDLPRNARTRLTFDGAPELPLQQCCFTGDFLTGIDLAAAGTPSGAFLSLARTGSGIGLRYYEYNFFGQDEWRVRPNFSLSFGLRYEYNTPPKEKHRIIEQTFTDPLLNNVNVRDINKFLAGRTQIFDPDKNNFEPRFGFAWSPKIFGPDHTSVLRAGYGVFHDQILGAVVSQSRNVFPNFVTMNTGGFNDPVTGFFSYFNPARGGCFGGSCGGFTPLVQPGTLNTFNPSLTVPLVLNIFANGANFPNPITITLPERRIKTPSAEQFSVIFEQQLNRDLVLSAGYVGTRGHNLLRASTPNLGPNNTLIVIDAGANAYGSSQPVLVGFALPPGPANNPNFDRPFPDIGPVFIFESGGRSIYDAMQWQIRGRFQRGLQFQANYTLSKARDDASDMFDLAGAPALPQDSQTRAGEFANSNFDSRHRLGYNLIFDFPKRNPVLNGLQIASSGYLQSGQPFTVNSIFDVNLDGNLTDRLDSTQGISRTGDRRQPIILGAPPRSLRAAIGQDGQVPRNSFRAGDILNLDLAVVKNIPFAEGRRLTFRMDIFNFTNRANFGIPVRFLEAPSFGQATSTVTPGRRIQFGMKFSF